MNDILTIAMGALILCMGAVVMLRPSVWMNLRSVQETYNPKLLASPYFRVQMRAIGALFTLFGVGWTGSSLQRLAPRFLRSWQQNFFHVFIAIFLVIWCAGMASIVLSKLGLSKVNWKERYDAVTAEEDKRRQQKEIVVMSSCVVVIVLLVTVITLVR